MFYFIIAFLRLQCTFSMMLSKHKELLLLPEVAPYALDFTSDHNIRYSNSKGLINIYNHVTYCKFNIKCLINGVNIFRYLNYFYIKKMYRY